MSYGVVIVTVLSGAAVGVGIMVRQILIKRREAKILKLSRQRDLTDFLADWKVKITTNHAENLSFVYKRKLPHLQTRAAAVRDCLGVIERAKFNELIGNLCRLTTGEITHPQGKSPQEVICEPLDELMGFVERV